MTYSNEDIRLITTLKEQNTGWKEIGKTLGKNPQSVRRWYIRYRERQALGERPVIKTPIVTPLMSRRIAGMMNRSPGKGSLPIRDFKARLEASFAGEATKPKIPSTTTIFNHLKKKLVLEMSIN